MDKKGQTKVKLNILGLSYSQTQTGAYALVLAEEGGNRRIPIIIGSSEAQSIAIQLEGLTPMRPLTHDLFVSMATAFKISLHEVVIYKLEEGIFYSELDCEDEEGRRIKIDARTSDAVALALRFHCSIFTYEKILQKAGIVIENDENQEAQNTSEDDNLEKKSLQELEELLNTAISEERYEDASKIRDIIKKKSE